MLIGAKRPLLDSFSAVVQTSNKKVPLKDPKTPFKDFVKVERGYSLLTGRANLRFALSRTEAEAILAWAVRSTDAFTGARFPTVREYS